MGNPPLNNQHSPRFGMLLKSDHTDTANPGFGGLSKSLVKILTRNLAP